VMSLAVLAACCGFDFMVVPLWNVVSSSMEKVPPQETPSLAVEFRDTRGDAPALEAKQPL